MKSCSELRIFTNYKLFLYKTILIRIKKIMRNEKENKFELEDIVLVYEIVLNPQTIEE